MKKLSIDDVAKIAHEINRTYCNSIGDTTQVAWEDAPQWQRDSAVNGIGFHLDNPDSTPEDSHKNWMKEKIQDGWIYGETKNAQQKIHPCLVPYEKLPVEQRVKDHLFIAVVNQLKPFIHYGD